MEELHEQIRCYKRELQGLIAKQKERWDDVTDKKIKAMFALWSKAITALWRLNALSYLERTAPQRDTMLN